MNLKNTSTHYGSVSKFLHWFIFILIASMLLIGFFMGDIPDDTVSGQVYNLHKLIGIGILFLMISRMIWALMNVKPSLSLDTPQWQRVAERSMHFLLYAVVIVMPLSGWIMSQAGGHSPHLGNMEFVLPIPKDKALKSFFGEAHEILAWTIIALVSLHIVAALYHHFIKKDDILQRMLPRK